MVTGLWYMTGNAEEGEGEGRKDKATTPNSAKSAQKTLKIMHT